MKRNLALSLVLLGILISLTHPSISKASTGPVDIQQLTATKGANAGQVTLWWKQVAGDVSAYHVVYGTQSLKH